MENVGNNFERQDPWRKAILKEREIARISKTLKSALSKYEGDHKNALILGDASLVQSRFFLEEEKFEHVVNVDSSPSIMDNEIVSIQDQRLERFQKEFDEYDFDQKKFDFVYGKSIAFNPKETVEDLLKNIAASLNEKGMFYALYGGEGDSYRDGISYTWDEIQKLYNDNHLQIVDYKEVDREVEGILNRQGRQHEFRVTAIKK